MNISTPSFSGLKPVSDVSSQTKRANKNKDTLHELKLRHQLWMLGLRYRKNVASLPGKPDIVFTKARIAVFCDGDFWHGRNWDELRGKLEKGANANYWIAKIESNIERDQRNNLLLTNNGWYVIRLWETDIKKDPVKYAQEIKAMIDNRSRI